MFDRRPLSVLLATCLISTAPLLEARYDARGMLQGGSGIAAFADDDDDDDDGGDDGDDDDDGGGRSSSSSSSDDDDDDDDFRPVIERREPRQRRDPVPLPVQAPDEVIVLGLDSPTRTLLEAEGYRLLSQDGGAALLQLPRGIAVEVAQQEIAALLPDALVAPNSYYRSQAGECSAEICASWALAAYAPATTSCAVLPVIGVVDTGVNLEHELLKDADITVARFVQPEADPSGLKHGTAVVAMLVGAADGRVPGMLPGARVHLADPFSTAAGDERAEAFGLYLALQSLVEAKVEIINMSLAGPDNPVLAQAVEDATAAGIPIVAAVGNAGPRAEALYPAAYDKVIAVTAVDHGRGVYRRAVQGPHVDFAAPGVGIATAASISGIRPQTGTSFAAPFVTVALLAARARDPQGGLEAHVAAVTAAAVDLGEAGHDPVFGHGLVQVGPPCP